MRLRQVIARTGKCETIWDKWPVSPGPTRVEDQAGMIKRSLIAFTTAC